MRHEGEQLVESLYRNVEAFLLYFYLIYIFLIIYNKEFNFIAR